MNKHKNVLVGTFDVREGKMKMKMNKGKECTTRTRGSWKNARSPTVVEFGAYGLKRIAVTSYVVFEPSILKEILNV